MTNRSLRLSKSRFTAGLQCHKLLWWKVHEPDAVELQPNKVLQDRFDQGRQVGILATARFPGGQPIDLPYYAIEDRVRATAAALESGAPAIYEASFFAANVYAAIDVLERLDGGFRLVEVKSSSSQKDEHIADAAVQRHVLAQSGLDVPVVEIMHLNRDFRHPDRGDLFVRTDVTTPVDAFMSRIPPEVDAQLQMLHGPLPSVDIGSHCYEPHECPFLDRCWPRDRNHIKKLYWVGGRTVDDFFRRGIRWISDLPEKEKLKPQQRRQIRAMAENRMIVEPTLARALEPFHGRLGYLDFETIARAVPVWPGMAPWQQAAAQFSYHEDQGDGTYSHAEFLAEGPEDARPHLARAMVEAAANAERVVTYTHFERTRIRDLQQCVPELASELKILEGKLLDLHPVVRDHVYHPDFEGSFSLKYILTPLVPDLSYDDLVIVDGLVASVEIARLLFVAGRLTPEQHEKTRHDLLEYCKRDTWATVRLVETLKGLADAARSA